MWIAYGDWGGGPTGNIRLVGGTPVDGNATEPHLFILVPRRGET